MLPYSCAYATQYVITDFYFHFKATTTFDIAAEIDRAPSGRELGTRDNPAGLTGGVVEGEAVVDDVIVAQAKAVEAE